MESILDQRGLKISRPRPGHAKEEFVRQVAAFPQKQEAVVSKSLLRRISAKEVKNICLSAPAVDADALRDATPVVEDVKARGLPAVLEYAVRYKDIPSLDSKIIYSKEDCKKAFESLPASQQALLQRVADRIRVFAIHQKNSIRSTSMTIAGGTCGQTISALERAGIYAPGGRYPLPSSVLMGAVTARVAGVATVIVASPRPQAVSRSACLLLVSHFGVAKKIGHSRCCSRWRSRLFACSWRSKRHFCSRARSAPNSGDFHQMRHCDGPWKQVGNRSKVFGLRVGGHRHAGRTVGMFGVLRHVCKSKDGCCRLACSSRARHCCQVEMEENLFRLFNCLKRPILVCIGSDSEVKGFNAAVEQEMELQLASLPTAETAREACLRNSIAVEGCLTPEDALPILDAFAAEHLELHGTETKTKEKNGHVLF